MVDQGVTVFLLVFFGHCFSANPSSRVTLSQCVTAFSVLPYARVRAWGDMESAVTVRDSVTVHLRIVTPIKPRGALLAPFIRC